MKILALIERPGHVCYRYRIAAFAPFLEAIGSQLEAVPLSRSVRERLAQLRQAREADVVILQRRLLPRWQLWLLRRWSRSLVYDFDDSVFMRDSFARKKLASWQRRALFRATVSTADAVIAGNDFLASAARPFAAAKAVSVIPTCIDPNLYSLARHERRDGVRLVWIGQRSTLAYLERSRDHLAAISQRVPGAQLRVISDVFPIDAAISTYPVPWTADSETTELASADIGVSWLIDDDWARGKCALKVLQYMAAGLPVVANRVGVQTELVRHGETGYLADTPQEWADGVARLAANPALRAELGRNGRRLVEERYSVASQSRTFLDALRSVAPLARAGAQTIDAPSPRIKRAHARQPARAGR